MNWKAIIPIALVIGAVVFLAQSGFMPQSIVAVSNVNIAGDESLVVALTVNDYQKTHWLHKEQVNNQDAAYDLTDDLTIYVFPQDVQCNYPLRATSFTTAIYATELKLLQLGSTRTEYYGLGSWEKDIPYQLIIWQGSPSNRTNKLFDSGVVDETLGVGQSFPSRKTFLGGKIKVENLGGLSQGKECPSNANAVLIPKKDSQGNIVEWRLASKSNFEVFKRDVSEFYLLGTTLANFAQGLVEFHSTMRYWSENPVNYPTSFYSAPSVEIPENPAGGKVIANMGKNIAGTPLITLTMSKSFISNLIYYPAKAEPEIVSIYTMDGETQLDQTEYKDLYIKVKNKGDETGVFEAVVSGQNHVRATYMGDKTIQAGKEANIWFRLYGYSEGTDSLCFTVSAAGGSVNQCKSFSVIGSHVPTPTPTDISPPTPTPISPPVCGNWVVEYGEQCDPPNLITCNSECQLISPPPTQTPTPTPPLPKCVYPQVLQVIEQNEPIWLFGFLPIQVGTATQYIEQCVLDPMLVILGIAIVAITIFGLLIWKKMR